MREASLHITERHLSRVLKSLMVDNVFTWDTKALAKAILKRGRKYSLTHRQVNVDKAKLIKSTSKVVMSSRDDAANFASLLLLIRRKNHHKGISIIKPGSRDWLIIKEITKLANDFCNDFQLKKSEGYKIYIQLSLDKMNKFSLMRFNSFHQTICDDYHAHTEIATDMTPQKTKEVMMAYEKYQGEKGIVRDYSKEPAKYIFFIKVKEQAIKFGVTINDYIKSQFEGLEWANAIPDPAQLVGDKAIDRLNRYIIKNGIKVNKKNENIQSLADKIKREWSQ